jgi:alanyl-tRNA synthetase
LTEIIAAEHGLELDREGFDKAMQKQQEQSKAGGVFLGHNKRISEILDKEKIQYDSTVFIREKLASQGSILFAGKIENGSGSEMAVALILDKTPFYLESGGQISDTGRIFNDKFQFDVISIVEHKGMYVHEGILSRGKFADVENASKKKESVTAEVDSERRWDIMRNHTATHLAHAALRKVLGTHVKQSGSYVGPDKLRFDFSHHQPMSPEEIEEVEKMVNEEIIKGSPVVTNIMPVEEAKKSGAMALFGEKYGETVRVVSVNSFSKELCGGTHVENVGQIGPFIITLETGVASGVRRFEAITGREAIKMMLQDKKLTREVAAIVGKPKDEIVSGVDHLKESNSFLQKELKRVKSEVFTGGGAQVGAETEIDGVFMVTHHFGDTDRDIMSGWIDKQKESAKALVALGLGSVNGKLTYMASASTVASRNFNIDIGKISKELLSKFGGQGGGKPNFAQGSVARETDSDKLFSEAKALIARSKEAK